MPPYEEYYGLDRGFSQTTTFWMNFYFRMIVGINLLLHNNLIADFQIDPFGYSLCSFSESKEAVTAFFPVHFLKIHLVIWFTNHYASHTKRLECWGHKNLVMRGCLLVLQPQLPSHLTGDLSRAPLISFSLCSKLRFCTELRARWKGMEKKLPLSQLAEEHL